MVDIQNRTEIWSRRRVIEGTLGVAGAFALCGIPSVKAAAAEARSSSTRRFFTVTEALTVDALVAQIIPTDDTPGAREMGVGRFIDHALGGFLSQLADSFRLGLAEFDAMCRARHPDALGFAQLSPDRQKQMLPQFEHTPFFETLQQLTVLGALTMPEYGGNQDRLGWQLIGFADQHGFAPPFGYYDRDYPGFRAPEPSL